MNLTPVPTLQKIALLKLATRVCYVADLQPLIKERAGALYKCRRRKIKKIIFSTELPKSLCQNLVRLMKPVMIEISSWILYIRHIHEEVATCLRETCSCLDEFDLLENLQWQTLGILDKRKITLDLIKSELLDMNFRFVLACSCCSEANILFLWQQLSSDVRNRISCFNFLPVVRYWTDRLKTAGKHNYKFIPNPSFPYVFQFEYSYVYLHAMYSFYRKLPCTVRNYLFGTYGRSLTDLKEKIDIESEENENRVTIGLVNVDNIAALEHFLKIFEPIKRQKLLEVVARNHFIGSELLVFCLSRMSTYQVKELLRSGHGSRVLSCFVNSPWQESLWDFIGEYWNDLTTTDLIELRNYIFNFKVKEKWEDFDYMHAGAKLYRCCHRKESGLPGEL